MILGGSPRKRLSLAPVLVFGLAGQLQSHIGDWHP
jgi:hypothetical protein